MKKTFFLFIYFLVSISLFAQSGDPVGILIYSEGESFVLSRNNEVSEYDVYYDDVSGFEFYEGDFVNTNNGTFLEIQLLPGSNIIKISENTSFQIGKIEPQGGGSFSITYGRVRAKVNRLVNNEEFSIKSPSIIAGVRGTDFGYDLVAAKGQESSGALTRVYCFEGKVEVKKSPEPKAEEEPEAEAEVIQEEVVIIEADQMITVLDTEPEKPLTPEPVAQEIELFWDVNEFLGEPIPIAMEIPVEEKPVEKIEEPEPEPEPEILTPLPGPDEKQLKRRRLVLGGTGFMVFGTVVGGVGGVFKYFGDDIFQNQEPGSMDTTANTLLITGGMSAGIGLLAYLGALLVGR